MSAGVQSSGGAVGALSWAAARRAKYQGHASGDGFLLIRMPGYLLAAVVDGAGSGVEAEKVANCCLAAICELGSTDLAAIFRHCHDRLVGSRGAAMALATIPDSGDALCWAAIGGIDGVVVDSRRTEPVAHRSIVRRPGTLGCFYRSPMVQTLTVARDDLIILTSDGVSSNFTDTLRPGRGAGETVAGILSDHAVPGDDSLALALRVGKLQ